MAEKQSLDEPFAANPQYWGRYEDKYEQAIKRCEFCLPEFQARAILLPVDGWIAVPSEFPPRDREGGFPEHAILLLPIAHRHPHSCLISADDWATIGVLTRLLEYKFRTGGSCLCTRRGRYEISGWTIGHIHWYWFVPRRVEDPSGSGQFRTIPLDWPVG